MKIAVFGYGSLVNPKSLQRTLGKLPLSQPVILNNWQRDWSAILENVESSSHYTLIDGDVPKNVAVLNIQRAPNSIVNGILIGCTSQELEALIKREVHYSIVDVTDDIEDVFGYDKIYSFTAKSEFTGSRDTDVIIPKSYLDLVEEGFRSLSKDQLAMYLKTTPTPTHRVKKARFIVP